MKISSVLLLLLVFSCSSPEKKKVTQSKMANGVMAQMHSSTMQDLEGTVLFEDLGEEIKVTADVKGLKPNSKLGFHIHEQGICEGDDYKSAGGHFNPYHKTHGRPEGQERHLGDMGNLETNMNGEAKKVILLPKVNDNDMDLIVGKAIIIHSGTDDLKTQPTGDAGGRIACGLIQR